MDQNNGDLRQEQQANESVDRAAARKAKILKEIKEWVVALVVAVLVVVVIQSFLFRIIRVDGHSMDTTLADGERLFVTVADIRFGPIERNSVVICHYPNRGWTYFVKRCVAIPGDTVYRENEVTHVVYEQDGQTIDEKTSTSWWATTATTATTPETGRTATRTWTLAPSPRARSWAACGRSSGRCPTFAPCIDGRSACETRS